MSHGKIKPKIEGLKQQVANLEQEKQQLQREKQQLEQRAEQLEREKEQLRHENEQYKKANELELALRQLKKNLVVSAAPPEAAPELNRESILASVQSLRAAERLRHNVGKQALDILRQGSQAQELANFESKRRAIASIEAKLESDAIGLTAKHNREVAESEASKLALFRELDLKREAWTTGSKVDAAKLLMEEGAKHAGLVESLTAKHALDEAETQKVLLKTLQKSKGSLSWNEESQSYQQTIDPRVTQATASRNERQRAHNELVASHEAKWKARQLDLTRQISLGQSQLEARVRFEDEYQTRLRDLVHDSQMVQQRQADELATHASERSVAIAAVMATYEVAEAEVQEGRRTVDEWWTYLCNEAVAHRKQIDEDEQDAFDEIDRLQAAQSTMEDASTNDIATPLTPSMDNYSELQPDVKGPHGFDIQSSFQRRPIPVQLNFGST